MSKVERIHSNLYFVKDLAKTADFYKKLGFDIEQGGEEVRIKLHDFTLCFMDESKVSIDKEVGITPKGTGVFTYVEVENVDEQYSLVVKNGVETSSDPTSFPWGKREFAVKDPDGYKIVFYHKENA